MPSTWATAASSVSSVSNFYPSAWFPSLDCSVVYPPVEDHGSADMWIKKRGPAAEPRRIIPADVKWGMAERVPDPLEVVRGSLDSLEEST